MMLKEIIKILKDYSFDILSFTVEGRILKISIYKNGKEKIIPVTLEIIENIDIPFFLRKIIDNERMDEWLKSIEDKK